jgi:hypothetical protein
MKSVGADKQGKLIQHFSWQSRIAVLADFARFSLESSHINVLMSAQMKDILIKEKADEEKNKEIMALLFDVARTLARQSIAFRGSGKDEDGNFIQIVNLLSRHYPDLKSWPAINFIFSLNCFRYKYLNEYLPPFKTKTTVEILIKLPFEQGVKCRHNITQTKTIVYFTHRLAKYSVFHIEKILNIS